MTRLRILVLDASIPHLSAIRRAIFSDGHTVETTTRKAEAKAALETRAFDLVVVDFHMPGQDGREVLRFLKSGAMIGAPRFIMYTNDATNGVMAQEYGFHRAFLAKGNLELLKSQLRTVVGEWQLEAVKAT
jgi:two-component system NtrC family sensor kinase